MRWWVMGEVLFRVRVFRDHVNILSKVNGRWVRVLKIYRDLGPTSYN
jgi:hypothetical protein